MQLFREMSTIRILPDKRQSHFIAKMGQIKCYSPILVAGLLALVLLVSAESAGKSADSGATRASTSGDTSSSSIAMASASVSRGVDDEIRNEPTERPRTPSRVPQSTRSRDQDQHDELDRPVIRKPSRRVHRNRQHSYRNEDDYADEDYAEDESRYFQRMFTEPMQHFRRMMGSMMDQVQGFGSTGAFMPPDGFGAGNAAMASSFSSSDGYSKVRSSVSNRGRTSGIVSETRNGRTITRRFGDDADDQDGLE